MTSIPISLLTPKSDSAGPVRRWRRAFTLLEMSVVLMLLGLAMALVLPRLGVVPLSILVSDTTNRLNSSFYTAASLAVATSSTILLTCDFAKAELRLSRDSQSGADPYGSAVWLGASNAVEIGEFQTKGQSPLLKMLSTVKLPTEVAPENELLVSDEPPVFVFYPNGEASGPTLRFRVLSRVFSLSVDPLTGRPLYEEDANY
jgi:prepilin-type N-terminal cleavage/methylation domain-containing protein